MIEKPIFAKLVYFWLISPLFLYFQLNLGLQSTASILSFNNQIFIFYFLIFPKAIWKNWSDRIIRKSILKSIFRAQIESKIDQSE